MSLLGQPPLSSNLPAHENFMAVWTPPWANWFNQVWTLVSASAQSGTTLQRPTRGLFPGRRYFDTDLGANGKPIFVNKTTTGWVLADGTAA